MLVGDEHAESNRDGRQRACDTENHGKRSGHKTMLNSNLPTAQSSASSFIRSHEPRMVPRRER